MKTRVEVPEEAVHETMRLTGAKSEREAVLTALEDFNRRRRLAALAEDLGTFADFLSRRELERLRAEG